MRRSRRRSTARSTRRSTSRSRTSQTVTPASTRRSRGTRRHGSSRPTSPAIWCTRRRSCGSPACGWWRGKSRSGTRVMRAMDNTWDHYQDNRVQWLLEPDSRAHLRAYVAAGFVGFLFGRGADGATCACDAAGDGVTDPAPIDGNTAEAVSADDDGGYFKQQSAAYYRAGAVALP